jgi:hypothetical protein
LGSWVGLQGSHGESSDRKNWVLSTIFSDSHFCGFCQECVSHLSAETYLLLKSLVI